MKIFKYFWQTLGLIGVLASINFAQGDRLVTPMGYVSPAGRFAILLPPEVTAQRAITPGEGTKGGMQFFWRNGDGEFFVSYFDNSSKSENPKQELEAMRDNYVSGVVKNGGKLLEKKDLTLDKNIGLEFRMMLQDKATVILRYFFVGKRVYILSTRLNEKETGEKQLKVLDSFRVVNGKVKP
jgi:hypothetical protein